MKTLKDMSRAGVTLVELLVVILIVTILAITMLPMFEKYVTKAQYAADAIPTVGHLKTQVDLYMYEHQKIPGTNGWVYGWSDGETTGYLPTTYAMDGRSKKVMKSQTTRVDSEGSHVATSLEINTSEGFGKRLKPSHLFYACLVSGGYQRTDNRTTGYGYAIGAFGNGEGLKRNTGFAALEVFFPNVKINTNGDTGYKLSATWQNYGGLNGDPNNQQVTFEKGLNALGVCPLPMIDKGEDYDIGDNMKMGEFSHVSGMYKTLRGQTGCGEWEELTFPPNVTGGTGGGGTSGGGTSGGGTSGGGTSGEGSGPIGG